jgi:sigma-B regulation protein RsbU (phosphoserine phosphatase)
MQPDSDYRSYLLSLVVFAGTAAIAYTDYVVGGNISLGYLYILPLTLSASIHQLPTSLGLVLVCVGLREWLGPFQEQGQALILRGLLTTLGFLTLVAIVNILEGQRNRLSESVRIQRDELTRDLELAAEVQRRLLPQRFPDLEGYEVAARLYPAKIVGGDYYDFLKLPGGDMGLVFADVAGKGTSAALLVSAVKMAVQVSAPHSSGPDKTLESLNQAICDLTNQERPVSFFYGCLEIEQGSLGYSNGGHHPPFLIKNSSREMISLETGGPVLGLIPGTRYESSTVKLEPGDLLVFYTDGIVEAENPEGEPYSQERLVSLVKSHQGRGASELIESVYQSVAEFRGSSLAEDDSTLLVVRVL